MKVNWPTVIVDGTVVENYGLNGEALQVDGRLEICRVFLGSLTKSKARKFRKAFYKAGWYNHASSVRTDLVGWVCYQFRVPRIVFEGKLEC